MEQLYNNKLEKPRHYLRVADLGEGDILRLINRAIELKRHKKAGLSHRPALGKVLGLLFEKPSTRTRISFEAAMFNLGGNVSFMSARDLQLRRGEPLKDTARALSRYIDCLVVRTFGQEIVDELAKWSDIPVINGLTDQHHPCQILSDVMTVTEKKGCGLKGLKVAWIGDGNNMAHSWIEAASRLGFELVLACPDGYLPDQGVLDEAVRGAKAPIILTNDPREAVRNADVINTDVWASMGQEQEVERRKIVFAPYQINNSLLGLAKRDAMVLHCLPAHRGEEITEEVIEGPQSAVWDQAENKMYIHMAILEWAMGLL
ncbi:MAG: ornithine carbamoyltransferase [Dissulfurimicrobium sp.]|uniref:ornithine carbamoyltransferase n=1 Tax=Dissulfurimicrobium sp. TaxID=2022436 RepID=UPI00404AE9C2